MSKVPTHGGVQMTRSMSSHGSVALYRPVPGDKVRVGLNGVFVETPTEALAVELSPGTALRMEIPLPNGVTIRPTVEVIGVDDEFFAADYVELTVADRDAIHAYYASRPSQRELLVWAVQMEVAAAG